MIGSAIVEAYVIFELSGLLSLACVGLVKTKLGDLESQMQISRLLYDDPKGPAREQNIKIQPTTDSSNGDEPRNSHFHITI